MKKVFGYIVMIVCAVLSAINYKIFVFPNSFAPAGVDGICTMIQYLANTSMGYFSLLVNIPLLIVGCFFLRREFITKSAVYTVAFSIATIVMNYVAFPLPIYHTETGTSIVLAPVAAGTIRGILYAITLYFGGSSGGVDIIAGIVQRKKPHLDLMNIIFAFNVLVAVSAFFVYGYKFEPAICSIIYSFITSFVSKSIQSTRKESVRVEIITRDCDSDALCREITGRLQVPATVIDAHGAYSGSDMKLVMCVLSRESVPKLETLLAEFRGAIAFESTVSSSIKIRT